MNYTMIVSKVDFNKKETHVLRAINVSETVLIALIENAGIDPVDKVEIVGTEVIIDETRYQENQK